MAEINLWLENGEVPTMKATHGTFAHWVKIETKTDSIALFYELGDDALNLARQLRKLAHQIEELEDQRWHEAIKKQIEAFKEG